MSIYVQNQNKDINQQIKTNKNDFNDNFKCYEIWTHIF